MSLCLRGSSPLQKHSASIERHFLVLPKLLVFNFLLFSQFNLVHASLVIISCWSRSWWLWRLSWEHLSGRWECTLDDTILVSTHAITFIHSGQFSVTRSSIGMSLGGGNNLENLDETHVVNWRMCKRYRQQLDPLNRGPWEREMATIPTAPLCHCNPCIGLIIGRVVSSKMAPRKTQNCVGCIFFAFNPSK